MPSRPVRGLFVAVLLLVTPSQGEAEQPCTITPSETYLRIIDDSTTAPADEDYDVGVELDAFDFLDGNHVESVISYSPASEVSADVPNRVLGEPDGHVDGICRQSSAETGLRTYVALGGPGGELIVQLASPMTDDGPARFIRMGECEPEAGSDVTPILEPIRVFIASSSDGPWLEQSPPGPSDYFYLNGLRSEPCPAPDVAPADPPPEQGDEPPADDPGDDGAMCSAAPVPSTPSAPAAVLLAGALLLWRGRRRRSTTV